MIWLINLLKKRPCDTSIRIGRIIFGIIYIGALYYNLIYQNNPNQLENTFFWYEINNNGLLIIKYIIISLGIIPIIMGVTNLCLLKSKYMRILQIFVAIMFFYISSKIIETPNLDVDTLILLMGFFPLIAGITGKCITTKCLRHGEVVTKIRV